MVKRKDRMARRQILQLKEEKSRAYSPPAKNPAIGPAEPSLSQGDNDEGDAVDEASKSEPASKNGVPRDAIDDQLEDFMKEIDAISSAVPETDPQGEDDKDELPDKEATTATSGCLPASGTPSEEVSIEVPQSKANTVDAPSTTEGEVPACPWVECMDEATGYTYFWHQLTNEVTWDCPPEYEAYWAQYGEPVDAESTVPGHGAAAAVSSATTSGLSDGAQVLPETSSSAPASSIAVTSPNSSNSLNVQAADACSTEGGSTKPAVSSATSGSVASMAGAPELSKTVTMSGKKKRKQEAAIGVIIPITSYGASDSSSSEGSDETYSVQRAQRKRHPSKRLKVAAKKSRRESPPLVAYGPQLPDSVLTQGEEPVYGPQLPDAPDSMEVTVYGPHLPEEEKVVYGPHLPEEIRAVYGPHLPEPEERVVYGPHLPEPGEPEFHQPPILIGPQLPEFHEFATEKPSTSVFIGPLLPDGFYEKRSECCEEEKPTVQKPCPRLEDTSAHCMELGEPIAASEATSAQGTQAGETVQESMHSPAAARETSGAPDETTVSAVPALSGLVDYPGSPVADSETDDEGKDTEDKKVLTPAPNTEKESTIVNYPVMTSGKLQFEAVVQDVPKKVVSQGVSQGSSNARVSSLAVAGQLKSKQTKEAKKGSQHLVSYGDSESSDDDSMDVNATATEPPLPSTARPALPSAADEEDEEEKHVGLGCSNRDAMDAHVTDDKNPPPAKPFVGVNFVRSSELLVLSECAAQGDGATEEKTKEAEKEQSPCSERSTGNESLASPQGQTTPNDSEVDDFDDVVRALDIALLESQKKKTQEDSTKHEDLSNAVKKELSSDTSEEEGEIRSSESSSEEGMTPMHHSSSDSEDEPEVDARVMKDKPSRRTGTSPKPESKDALKLDIEEAYKQLTDQLNPLRDVIACRNSYFELVVKTMTRMEDWRAGALGSDYFLQKLHDARAAAAELHQLVQAAEKTQSDEPCQEPLPPGWQRHWDSGHARYFYVHEETGHSQWVTPTVTDASSGTLDSTSPTTDTGVDTDKSSAALLLQPPPPPPPETDEAPVETATKQEDETEVDGKVDEKLDGTSLDAAEAAFYSSFVMSAEPVINAAQTDCGDGGLTAGVAAPVDAVPVNAPPVNAAPVDEASVPTVAAPKKKKTKVSSGLTLRKKNIPTLLQKWEKIKEEQKRGMSS
ncbi:uncharacterized protein [Dermacentor andersoni]|uniref:uncharacterized protein isoform X1 n=1 Tax=Dermacentor andersoni TaxID=34620 RepID=UPI002155F4F7|nr:uncharacterized protein LOC126536474 isoform X1 [Dermacentor andersoni]XP_054930019.1 uncharacterized protein LOC126536474 isoform X1 [Dermacentor andersoni]